MSHDLYFYKKDGKAGIISSVKNIFGQQSPGTPATDKEMLTLLAEIPHFGKPDITPDGFDAGYLNPETGSQFFFNLHRSAIPEFEKDHHFKGYSYTGLTCSLNYCRPTYFMLEAAPFIEGFANVFELAVVDFQEKGKEPSPRQCTALDLIRSYQSADTESTRGLYRSAGGKDAKFLVGPDLNAYLPDEKATLWWNYTYNKRYLESQMEKTKNYLYIPELMVMQNKSDGSLFTVMAFGDGVGYLIPPCDAFFVQRKNFSETGLVPASVLMPLLKPYVTEIQAFNATFHILSVENADRFTEILRTIPLDSGQTDYARLPPGGFIDIKLS